MKLALAIPAASAMVMASPSGMAAEERPPVWQVEAVISRPDLVDLGANVALDHRPVGGKERALVTSFETFQANPNDRPYGTSRVHLYTRARGGSWTSTTDLPPPNAADADVRTLFGAGVLLSGDTALVASPKPLEGSAAGAVLTRGRVHVYREDAGGHWNVASTFITSALAGEDQHFGEPLVGGSDFAWFGTLGSDDGPPPPKSRVLSRVLGTSPPALPWTLDETFAPDGVPLAYDDETRTIALVTEGAVADVVRFYRLDAGLWKIAGGSISIRPGAQKFARTELSQRSAFHDEALAVPGGDPGGSTGVLVRIGTASPAIVPVAANRAAFAAALTSRFLFVYSTNTSGPSLPDELTVYARAAALPWPLVGMFPLAAPTQPPPRFRAPEGRHMDATARSLVVVRSGAVHFLRYGVPRGATCKADADCASDFCVDGVCCESSCNGGDPRDCQSCSAALTGAADGICAPVRRGTTCGASLSGECDEAEICDGASRVCPADAKKPDGTRCRDGLCSGGRCAASADAGGGPTSALDDRAPRAPDEGCASAGTPSRANWLVLAGALFLLLRWRRRAS